MDLSDYIDTTEMAAMHSVAENTLIRILRADLNKPENERKIPGAVKVGSKHGGRWLIPRTAAEAWQRDKRGRK